MSFLQATDRTTADDFTLCPKKNQLNENRSKSKRQKNSDRDIRNAFIPELLPGDIHVIDAGKKRKKQTAKVKKAKEASKEKKKLKKALKRHLADLDDTPEISDEEKKRRRELWDENRRRHAQNRPANIVMKAIRRQQDAQAIPGLTAVVSAPVKNMFHKIIDYRPRRLNLDLVEEELEEE
ncbi:hypothetical protein HA402_005437 [Bradysia odoriphaga]|nr:hypothetical protein HA402_005437 [Bradysia odoriphaga]